MGLVCQATNEAGLWQLSLVCYCESGIAGRDGCAGSSNSVCSCVCVHLGVLCVQVCAKELFCSGSERERDVEGCCICINEMREHARTRAV